MIKKEEKISNLFKYYFDIRMLRILLLGAISGFPWVLIGSSLSLWLKEEGLSRSTRLGRSYIWSVCIQLFMGTFN